MNNTSIPFFLPSEFKSKWNNLLINELMEGFESFWKFPDWLCHLIQDFYLIVYREAQEIVKTKLFQVLKVLDINHVDERASFKRYLDHFRGIFQENFSNLFMFNEEKYQIIFKYLEILPQIYENFTEFKVIYDKDLNKNSYKYTVEQMYYLSIYMILHDPALTLNIEEYSKRQFNYHFFNKEKFISLEGYTNNDPCLVILNPPFINSKYAYQGLKPAVYLIKSTNIEINEICKRNQLNEKKKDDSLVILKEETKIESKEINNLPLKNEYTTPRSTCIKVTEENQNGKYESIRNNTDSDCHHKNYFEHPLCKSIKQEFKNLTVNENVVNDKKSNILITDYLNEEELMLNTETVLLTNNTEKVTEPFDIYRNSFTVEKKSPLSKIKVNYKIKTSDNDIKKEKLDENLFSKIKSPSNNKKTLVESTSSKIKSINIQKFHAKTPKTVKLEFHSNNIKEVPLVKYPVPKDENYKLQKNKQIVGMTPTSIKKEKNNINLKTSHCTDPIESLMNQKAGHIKINNKVIDRSNKLYSYLMYNEITKNDSKSVKRKGTLAISSRVNTSKYSTLSKEKKMKI